MNIRNHGSEKNPRLFKRRVAEWAGQICVKPSQIRVQDMSRKWASCSTRGWVTFSSDLLHEPKRFQDFVIVHELLHLKIRNHGKLFKSLLSGYAPGWQEFAAAHRHPARMLATKG